MNTYKLILNCTFISFFVISNHSCATNKNYISDETSFLEEISIKELAIKIKNVIDYQGDLKFDQTKPDGNPRKLLDSSKINELGWFSQVSLDDGLIKTYEWFLKNN